MKLAKLSATLFYPFFHSLSVKSTPNNCCYHDYPSSMPPVAAAQHLCSYRFSIPSPIFCLLSDQMATEGKPLRLPCRHLLWSNFTKNLLGSWDGEPIPCLIPCVILSLKKPLLLFMFLIHFAIWNWFSLINHFIKTFCDLYFFDHLCYHTWKLNILLLTKIALTRSFFFTKKIGTQIW